MRGFYYFIPGPVSRESIDSAGLGYLFDGRSGPGPTVVGTTSGPGGKAGTFFTVAGRGERGAPELAGVDWSRVRWAEIPGSPASLGLLEGELPGPEDLARAEQVDGHLVELGDGAQWLVPVVRRIRGGTSLPRALKWQGKEWVEGDVRPAYRSLWAAGLRLWDSAIAKIDGPITLTEETSTAVTALAVNYRLGPAEASELGLLDSRTAGTLLLALIDVPVLRALAGKAGAATPSSARGGEAS